jgi:hypothetical protein
MHLEIDSGKYGNKQNFAKLVVGTHIPVRELFCGFR